MEKLNTEDGQLFVKNLARFVRTHEKALANALQMRRQPSKSIDSTTSQSNSARNGSSSYSATSSALAAALSIGTLNFTSHAIKPAKLTLTPHHLFYLLSRFEELSVSVGPMNVRLENINTEASSAYMSFLTRPQRPRGDRESIHSVSSVRSVLSGMSVFWSSFGLGSKDSVSKSEKAKAAIETDLKYLYSAFTKIPCLRLAPDYKARLIRGYEEFPFDTAVPLHAFKNLGALEIIDVDFRSFFGWDRMAEQLRSLTLKRANIEDVGDLLTGIVLDDIDKRRRRSSKYQPSPVLGCGSGSTPRPESINSSSAPGSPVADHNFGSSASTQRSVPMMRGGSQEHGKHARGGSTTPPRPTSSKHPSSHRRGPSMKLKRSGSGSSNSSDTSTVGRNRSMSNLLAAGVLPSTKWRFLRYLSLTDNSLTTISAAGLEPVANSLHSLDLSWNLFAEVPDGLGSLVALRSLNLSHCMIDSLHSLLRNPLPAITTLNLRGNRFRSIAGVERLLSLERLDLRDNDIRDPTEMARLTAIPYLREIWVSGNPFTKSHVNYRVTIFNLFRQTHGFSDDIIIDNTGPTYTERKQLVERVAQREEVPIVLPRESLDDKPAIQAVTHSTSVKGQGERPIMPNCTQREYAVGSSRRKKGHRRRIVDLSHEESSRSPEPVSMESSRPAAKPTLVDVMMIPIQESQDIQQHLGPSSSVAGQGLSDSSEAIQPNTALDNTKHLLPAIEDTDWDTGGDVYRQRLEALKREVGTNWLTALGDETWIQKQKDLGLPKSGSDFHAVGPIRPPAVARTSSQAIATGGHTLS